MRRARVALAPTRRRGEWIMSHIGQDSAEKKDQSVACTETPHVPLILKCVFQYKWFIELNQNLKWNFEIWIIIGSSEVYSLRVSLYPPGSFLCLCVFFWWWNRNRWVWFSVKPDLHRNWNLAVNNLPGAGFEFLALDLQRYWIGRVPCVMRVMLTEKSPARVTRFDMRKTFLKTHMDILKVGPQFV